ncbi:hypothetical protein BZL41_11075 [Pseudomonas sp. PIC25]|nr:hypothetical protein BZL41_11075 [Pseudomonas sp. PIC25]
MTLGTTEAVVLGNALVVVRQAFATPQLRSLPQTGQAIGQSLALVDVLVKADGTSGILINVVWTALPNVALLAAKPIKNLGATPLIVQAFAPCLAGNGTQAVQMPLSDTLRADGCNRGINERLWRPFEHMPLRTTETVQYLPTEPGCIRARQVEALGGNADCS